jgi:hypothetical protein
MYPATLSSVVRTKPAGSFSSSPISEPFQSDQSQHTAYRP